MAGPHDSLEQIELTRNGPHQRVSCLVNSVGASLEALSVDSFELIERFPRHAPRPLSAGVTLAPWPNRIRDGRWSEGDVTHQLAITEPARHNAIHGLVSDKPFQATVVRDDELVLSWTISEEQGYPHTLTIEVHYALTDSGLTVGMSALNRGPKVAPVALGAHPYVCLGDIPTRTLRLTSPVDRELVVDDQMIPVSTLPIGSDQGLRAGVELADAQLDTAYALAGPGGWSTTLESPQGPALSLWQDESMGWIQLFITDEFPGLEGMRTGLAIEPMTAPPNSLASGEGLHFLEPGNRWSVHWGIERVR